MAPTSEPSPFTPQLVRGLSDKLYEKRKAAALEVERLIRDALSAADQARVAGILNALIDDFAYSSLPNARNGGLIALAAAAIALGTNELGRHLDAIVPPILSCFTDQDSRIRYYACESMYNVAKVARGDILKYFNEVFDALSKLSSDADPSAKNAAELLDRLMKDIVSERAVFWAPDQKNAGPDTAKTAAEQLITESAGTSPIASAIPPVPGTVPYLPGMKPTQFNLARFIPLLSERIHTLAPFTRMFLVQWISVLDSVPDLELIAFLPDFLDGLFNYLSDPNIDVRVATLNVLSEFLKEIRDVLLTQRERGVLRIKGKDIGTTSAAASTYDVSESSFSLHGGDVESANERNVTQSHPSLLSPNPTGSVDSLHAEDGSMMGARTRSAIASSFKELNDPTKNESLPYVPGLGVTLDIGRMTGILIPHLMSTDEETQATSLRWINEFILLAREVMVPFCPMLLNAILPSLAHSVAAIKSVANEANATLYRLILDLPIAPLDDSFISTDQNAITITAPAEDTRSRQASFHPTPGGVFSTHFDFIDVQSTVETLTLQFQDEREETRVAALDWLLMLHKKSPKQVLSSDDATFQALLRTLSDSSEEVVKRDLQLLAQVSQHSDDEYFTRFMVSLLSLFSTDRRLLETRGSLIVRQLCLSLHPERMYRTFAEILEREEDLEFASTMVQNLNFILITAPELIDLRRRLRNLESRDGILLFTVLYRSWCHNAVAVFSLCLLAQAYEHASHLLTLFADLEITVNLLIQIDKLVQLLESPVFTYLRLQLLEPDRYPYLFKCLYGILMLLPQSSAFATLRNRLNSVSSMVFMSSGAMGGGMGAGAGSVTPPAVPTPGESAGRNGFSPLGLRRSKPSTPIQAEAPLPPPSQPMRWAELLQHFRSVQSRHERSRRSGGTRTAHSLDRHFSTKRRPRARTDVDSPTPPTHPDSSDTPTTLPATSPLPNSPNTPTLPDRYHSHSNSLTRPNTSSGGVAASPTSNSGRYVRAGGSPGRHSSTSIGGVGGAQAGDGRVRKAGSDRSLFF